ncbi:MAG: hypothetical protein LCI00_14675 [Chloroflexi bacterium]|nr:hypothetical protein [Chloroflexota bacterium]MCC6894816.1 hypothetical protein [Anaerolineae bacterium]
MKKLSKKQPRMKSLERFDLEYAGIMMQTERWDEAYETLLPIMQKHPYDTTVLQMMNDVSFEVEDIITALITSYRLVELLPDASTGYMNMALAGSQLQLAFTTFHYADLYLQRWGNEPEAADIRELKAVYEKACVSLRENDPIHTARPDAHLALLEQCELLVRSGFVQEARIFCEKAIELIPDTAAPYNSIVSVNILEGSLTEALSIAITTVERFPDNYHTLCNLVQLYVRLGQLDEAKVRIAAVKNKKVEHVEQWGKLIETLSYIGDDAEIVRLYQQNQKSKEFNVETIQPLAQHLIATALARMGDRKAAEKLWKALLKQVPDFDIAADNLDDLKSPAGEQNGPWAFPFYNWFPFQWIEQLIELTLTHNEKIARKRIEQIIRDTRGMETALQVLLERGDPEGRKFVINLSGVYPVDGLVEFVQSTRGTDADRAMASQQAVEQGLLPRGTPVKMYEKGKQKDRLFLNYEIHGEADRKHFPKHVQRLYEKSAEAVSRNDFTTGLQFAQEAFVLLPNDPGIMNQMAICLINLKRRPEAEALIRQNAELNPDYLFARCAMANLCSEAGKIAEAKEWIAPLLKRSRFHFSEFKMLAYAQAELLKAEGKHDVARTWIDFANQAMPTLKPKLKGRSWMR